MKNDRVRFKDLVDLQDQPRNSQNGELPPREPVPESAETAAAAPGEGEKIFDLTEILEEPSQQFRAAELNEVVRKMVAEVAERIAREIVPGIAEKVIREEIEKLKSADEDKKEQP